MSDRLRMIQGLLDAGSEDPFHWYARAMELRSLDRLDEALQAYDDVKQRFASYVPTYLMAAQVAAELERPNDARRWVEDGLKAAGEAGDDHAKSELSAFLDSLD